MLKEVVVLENVFKIVAMVVINPVLADANSRVQKDVVIVVKEIVLAIVWELVKQHVKAAAKTHVVEVVPILVQVVLNNY